MALPTITVQNITDLLPEVTSAIPAGRGGQKIVFRIELNGQPFALKLALLSDAFEPDIADIDETVLRARRETQIMQECKSPYMVKAGPIELRTASIAGQNVLYFQKSSSTGALCMTLSGRNGALLTASVVQLGLQMCSAIDDLWSLGKIHRDIKPGNIMQRSDGETHVLLDAGLAFDVVGESISAGFLVGTMAYFSPEQFDYTNRRVMDFRSDMFSLGATLYEAATGQHPFFSPTTSTPHLYTKITKHNPSPTEFN